MFPSRASAMNLQLWMTSSTINPSLIIKLQLDLNVEYAIQGFRCQLARDLQGFQLQIQWEQCRLLYGLTSLSRQNSWWKSDLWDRSSCVCWSWESSQKDDLQVMWSVIKAGERIGYIVILTDWDRDGKSGVDQVDISSCRVGGKFKTEGWVT